MKKCLSSILIFLLLTLAIGTNAFAEETVAKTQTTATGTVTYSGSGNNYVLNITGGSISGGIVTNDPATWPTPNGSGSVAIPATGQISQVNISGTVTFTSGGSIPTVTDPAFPSYTGSVGLVVANSCTVSGPGTLTSQNGSAMSGSSYTKDTITPLFISGQTTAPATAFTVNLTNNLNVTAGLPGFDHGGGCYLAVGVQGAANVNINRATITGLPGVMAIASPNKSVHKDDYHQVNVVSNVNIGAGANITTSNSYTNSTMAVIRTQGNDAGIVNFTINGGTVNGIANWGSMRNYAPGYYGASRGGSITVNSGTIEGYTGLLLRSGNATVTGGTIEGEGPAPGSGQQAVISSSDVGNAGGITLSGSNHRYGNISVNITGGTIISDNYSAINTYQSQETTQNSYPILNSSDFKVSGATLSGATVPILRTGTAEYSNASTVVINCLN